MRSAPRTALILLTASLTACVNLKEYHPPTHAKSLTVKNELRWNAGLMQKDFIFPPGVYPAFLEDSQGTFFRNPPNVVLDPKARNTHNECLAVSFDGTKGHLCIWPEAMAGPLIYEAAGAGKVPIRGFALPAGWQAKVHVDR